MTGYKKMISDNIPRMWDLALRWCGCRTKWIDYVYNTHIAPLNKDWRPLKERNRLKSLYVKIYTHKSKDNFGEYVEFKYTINLDTMYMNDRSEYNYWKKVCDWVSWFEKMYSYVESSAEIQISCNGLSIDEAAEYVNNRYNLNNLSLAYYVINNIKPC